MKTKLLISVFAITAIISLSACDRGHISASNSKVPDQAYFLEALGDDLRVYEFTPQSEPNARCIFIAGSSKAGATCFQKYLQ